MAVRVGDTVLVSVPEPLQGPHGMQEVLPAIVTTVFEEVAGQAQEIGCAVLGGTKGHGVLVLARVPESQSENRLPGTWWERP